MNRTPQTAIHINPSTSTYLPTDLHRPSYTKEMISYPSSWPSERHLGWSLKPLSRVSKSQATCLPSGQVQLEIHHAPLKGITTEMLTWWMAH